MPTLSKMGSFSLLAIACLTIMVGCVIVPGLPVIAEQLGMGQTAGLLVTIPALGVVVFGPLAGKLIDRIGLYKSLCLGLLLYGVLGAGGVMLHGTAWVLANRLLLGGATALVMAGGTGLISVFYHDKARLRMIANQGMAIELGGVIFLFLGGLLAMIGWRWPFLLYLVSWLMLALLLVFVPDRDDPQARHKATATKEPVPAALKRVFASATLSMLAFFTAIIILPSRLHELALNEAQTGYFLSFVSLVAVGAAALMPRFVTRLSEHATLVIAFTCYALAHALFALAPGLALILLGGIFMGTGFGLSVPLVNHMTIEQSHAHARGRNLAYLSMAIFSGQFLCSAVELMPSGHFWIFAGSMMIAGATAVWIYRLTKVREALQES